ncbi:3'(2'),5'-bisphosphate nucleotidase CysQ [Thioflexithrix psekupsensis]|uniref:3'(2'),5'-bisphosphate nucleotidase CysQ n=1 Tax=Thioflexithrix psekupsensis TaxID=1570016 RepID=A0A251X911_9GAMM|nr:3'(2'),5'-bisphosphate nucleotidase CysQ [Thioflexithrix psekupsensis]OUD14420.1 3'(2'),5'-bisphosphate nucleotidase [Thioflexithrix psekupsensis]
MLCQISESDPDPTEYESQDTGLSELAQLTEASSDIARQAGERILQLYNTPFDIWHKPDGSPVTSADIAAHRIIVEALSALTPELPILSEESAHVSYLEREQWSRYWLVDPLDGTLEFVHRRDHFTVNIALIVDQKPVLGVIYAPVSGVLYYAYNQGGSYKQLPGHLPHVIQTRAMPENRIVVAGSYSRYSPKVQSLVSSLGEQTQLLSVGSSLKSCLVAEGAADIYPCFGLTSEWDTAAAQCILEEAGGHLTDMSLNPLRYNTKRSLLNPNFLAFADNDHPWQRHLLKTALAEAQQ